MLHFPSPDIGMFGRRQRHVRGHRIPVTITREAAVDPECVAVTDTFGAHDVAPLLGGCSCCTVRAGLQGALRQLLAERGIKSFGRVVIESRQDLGPILRTFGCERALGGEYHVENAPSLDGDCFVLTENAPLSWDAFGRLVTTLTALRGADMLHVRGLLDIAGCRGPVSVQIMGHLAARPVELQAWPDSVHASRLEFVTRGIEERVVRELFNATRARA
jgi:G3E family GTPase